MSGVEVARVGGVLQVILDALERRNALSAAMLDSLVGAIGAPGEDVTGIVLTGSETTFSAGADFADLTGTSADIGYDDRVSAVAAAVAASRVPVLAALEGPCFGAAAHLALVCDARIAGDGVYLSVPAIRLGLLYNPDAIAWLARHYPRDTIRRLFLLAERFDASEAAAAGLVSTVVPAGTARDHATKLLASITPAARDAVAATRRLLDDLDAGDPERFDAAQWQRRRRELLDSPERAAAIVDAKRRHTVAPR